MGNDLTFSITGVDELIDKMGTYPQKFLDKGVRNALNAGAEPMRLEISARSLVLTGFEQDHVAKVTTISARNDKAEVLIGWVRKAFYAMFSEFGTKNQPAHPVMRPAFQAKAQECIDVVTQKLTETFQEVFKQ
jgi:HK97 gp10 family phage protein